MNHRRSESGSLARYINAHSSGGARLVMRRYWVRVGTLSVAADGPLLAQTWPSLAEPQRSMQPHSPGCTAVVRFGMGFLQWTELLQRGHIWWQLQRLYPLLRPMVPNKVQQRQEFKPRILNYSRYLLVGNIFNYSRIPNPAFHPTLFTQR